MAQTGTIVAVASAPGSALRGVIRVSGDEAWPVVERVVGQTLPRRRGALAARAQDAKGGIPVQVLCMPSPASFTREDVLELHCPGNGFLVQAVLAQLLQAGARLAEPGEFIRRAFLNGRLDLTQVEGVLALIEAQDQNQRRAASALLFGGLQARLEPLRNGLESLRALCEASLDFDEADTGHVPSEQLLELAYEVLQGLGEALAWETRRETSPGQALVVLAGAPNAGKSSLFNALTHGPLQALVENQPGSTRDVLRAPWNLGEQTVQLADTAGAWRLGASSLGDVEQRAQKLARAEWKRADVLLWVVDGGDPVWPHEPLERPALLVWNQVDRKGVRAQPTAPNLAPFALGFVATSAVERTGLEPLAARVERILGVDEGAAGWTRSLGLRHRNALEKAEMAVLQAIDGLLDQSPLDWIAEDLRQATHALDEITGSTTPEDLLSRIFAQFCLGK